jgi:hypothetical protein
MAQYEVHVWADAGAEPEITAYDLLEDAREALRRALETGEPARVDVVNPDGIVIESAER